MTFIYSLNLTERVLPFSSGYDIDRITTNQDLGDSRNSLVPSTNADQFVCTCKMSLMSTIYYANMPMQYTAIFHGCKNVNFQMKQI